MRKITEFGVFVGFLGDLSGLAWRNVMNKRNAIILNEFISLTNFFQ